MKRVFFIVLIALAVFSCKKENRWDCIKRTGPVLIQERAAFPFDSLFIQDNIQVFITHGTEYSIHVEAGKNLLENISTDINNRKLTLANQNKCKFSRAYKPIVIAITVPALEFIHLAGPGSITGTNKLQIPSLKIVNRGTGNIELEVESIRISTISSNVGDIQLRGSALHQDLYIRGHCFVDSQDLLTINTNVFTDTTGDIVVQATGLLFVSIAGKGNVYYVNEPAKIETNLLGEGKLFKK